MASTWHRGVSGLPKQTSSCYKIWPLNYTVAKCRFYRDLLHWIYKSVAAVDIICVLLSLWNSWFSKQEPSLSRRRSQSLLQWSGTVFHQANYVISSPDNWGESENLLCQLDKSGLFILHYRNVFVIIITIIITVKYTMSQKTGFPYDIAHGFPMMIMTTSSKQTMISKIFGKEGRYSFAYWLWVKSLIRVENHLHGSEETVVPFAGHCRKLQYPFLRHSADVAWGVCLATRKFR